jgi:hypothetical protein
VNALRIWNTAKGAYDEVESMLVGAPEGDEARTTYWTELCDRIKTAYGDELWAEMTSKTIGKARDKEEGGAGGDGKADDE